MQRYILCGILLACCISLGGSSNIFHLFQRQTCIIYGDPHLRLFSGGFLTCAAYGWQTVLRNRYVYIRGFNYYPFPGASGTYMTAVHMIFYDGYTSSVLGYYYAMHNVGGSYQIPHTFIGGANILYDSTGNWAVFIWGNGQNVWIYINYGGGIAIRLSRWGYTYHMVIRQYSPLTAHSTGLCVCGCDAINIWRVIHSRGKRQTDECSQLEDVNMQNACRFDVAVTGNAEMAIGIAKLVNEMVGDIETDKRPVPEEATTKANQESVTRVPQRDQFEDLADAEE